MESLWKFELKIYLGIYYMPRYSKKKWNKKYVKQSHNCYSYMLNKINKKYVKKCKSYMKKTKKRGCHFLKAQPGMYSGMKDVRHLKNYNCNMLNRRILADNKHIIKTKKNRKCPKKYYKGVLYIHPNRGYHFYRQDSGGTWSHKDGLSKSTKRDAKNRIIKNIGKSNRKYKPTKKEIGLYYSRKCATYCIPEDPKKKFFSAYTRKRKKSQKKRKKKKTRKR